MRSQIQMAVLVGFLAAVVIAFGPAMVLSRRLSRRVERLAHYSQQVTRGERIERLVPAGSDAVSRLEANMGQLALNLSDQVYAAREEKGRLEAVLRGMVEGVLVLDGQGTVVLSNRRAEELFDLPEGESCAGRRLIELTRHPELHELVRRVMRTENGGHPITEDVALDPSRRSVLQVSASPIRSEDGVFRTFILVCHDISELQRLEATRRDFVANVSHELRTPLAAIRGYSETLQTGALEDPENARRFLGIIERHAERLGRLVDDLLTLSDLELGKADLQKRETHIATVVESACEVLQAKATNAGVILQAQVAPQLPPLIADSDRLVQVLLNLVDNAIKYSPRGGTVVISAGPASVAGERKAGIELAVADDGVGVPPADLPRLTERFYRVDRARSRELGGTGLGLAIVKHIVQAHGGSLRIESEPGQGTTVRVYVPLAA